MAEVISTNQFKNGMHVEVDGTVYRIVEFQHVKPGKGGAFVRTKLKALESGAVVDKTFRAGEKMPRIHTEVKNVTYLYSDGSDAHLMDSETFDQIALSVASISDELQYMRENDTVQILTVDGRPTTLQLPAAVELAVTDTEPGVKGDTVSNVTKPATLETGAVVQVPLFVNVGDRIRVDTREARYILTGVTRIVDTTVRLLSQQPLAGTISTARVLEVAEILDAAGFAALEVSGGGCFAAAVEHGAESPWERIRALHARCTKTPLQMALRGRFLVGSKPLPDDLVRRFILCAAESGIEIFRLQDPLNDVENLASAGSAVREAGCRLYAGLAFSGYMPNLQRVVEKARRLAELGADHILLHDPAGALDPGTCGQVITELREAAGVPVGLYCQGTGGNALAMAIESARLGAEPIATAVLPVAYTLHRVAAEVLCDALTGLGLEHGVDAERVWAASRFIDDHVTSQMPALPIPPRITLRTAFNRLPVGLVADLDARLRMLGAPDRLDEVLEEFKQVRIDCGMPPLGQPIGGILAGQAVRHVLSARRWAEVSGDMREYLSGVYGNPPQEIAAEAAALAGTGEPEPPAEHDLEALRAEGLAASEEDLLLVALFGEEAHRLLLTLRNRGERDDVVRDGLERAQSERIRELIEMVEDSDVGELTLEDAGVRITVKKQEQRPVAQAPQAAAAAPSPAAVAADNGAADTASVAIKIESPMVGTFYRSATPTADPFVEEGDRVEVGQTICILEAMKLFNELKSEHAGVIRSVLVRNAEPVEFGQPLFELELA